ncbi:hypothetical protein CTAYLR_008540 [Chrysophaeum taylorii]|uniref:phosphoglycerate mutase (2,3-diphosphoglycerate-dependent) n=1 Tax=Chrysophaeum taylorii TaxID=2483200 RepID=A0AAD7XHQ6_9STRA|nr:hypothetical protein CTAYLR_008540 [Chrysophaeum taylorii]
MPQPIRMSLTEEVKVTTSANRNKCGTLILLRHAESIWNVPHDERFTGWTDVPLTRKGEFDATAAGKTLNDRGVEVEVAFTSLLQRASRTLDLALASCEAPGVSIRKSWRLNERHYGALQGLNKAQAAIDMGHDIVREWRRSWDVPPPAMTPSHPLWDSIYGHPMYAKLDVPVADLPHGESVAQCATRLEPYWFSDIVPVLRSGKCTMVCAHANSLRALLRIIFRRQVTDHQIRSVKIPTGVPLIYRLEEVPRDECDPILVGPDPVLDLCEGLSENPDYDLVPQPPPPGCEDLTGEMLWPLEECPIIYHDWKLEAAQIKAEAIKAATQSKLILPRPTTD